VLANEAPATAQPEAPPGKAPDRTRPTVTIKSPAYGAPFNRNLVTVTGTVDDATAAVTVNGVHATIQGGTFTTNVVLTEQGSNPLVATAVDRAGNQSKDSIMVTLDSIAPDISISQPANGLVTLVGKVAVSGRISDANDVTDARINDAPLALDRGEFSINVPLNRGNNVIVVSARDAAGNYRSMSTDVYLDAPLPISVVAVSDEPVEVEDADDNETIFAEGGTLTGKVTFNGVPPPPKMHPFAKFPNSGFCEKFDSDGRGNRVVQEVRVGKDQALRDVVVAIEDVENKTPFEFQGTKVNADGCRFLVQDGPSTLVGVVVKKKEIVVENFDADPSDPKAATGVLHNPHAYEVSGTSRTTIFNVPLAEKGQVIKKPVILRKAESYFYVECDQHNFMQAYFFSVENPYYAIVRSDGMFSIRGIPPGTYDVVAWHPILGKRETRVTIRAQSQTSANFSFAAK
jgi:hypothetical protein